MTRPQQSETHPAAYDRAPRITMTWMIENLHQEVNNQRLLQGPEYDVLSCHAFTKLKLPVASLTVFSDEMSHSHSVQPRYPSYRQ